MTQYMLSVSGAEVDPEMTPEDMQQMFEAVNQFNQKLQASGSWVFAGGLAPIESSTVVDGRADQAIITDGPFAESKEWIGGFWVVDFPDLDSALQWATEASAACGETVEVRPFHGE